MKNLKKKTMLTTLALAMAFTAFGSIGDVNAFAAGEEHTHTFTNGFCETVAGETHYQEPTLNNNGTESDTADDYYEIGNAGQLYWFAEHVNYRVDNTVPNIATNAKLTADIVVNENVIVNGELNEAKKDTFRVWTPIGYLEKSVGGYSGTFDGQGFTVSGLYFNNAEVTNVGLFYRLGDYWKNKPATIKNIGVIDSYFRGKRYVGAIAGLGNEKSTITNGFSYGCLIYGDDKVGGITGDLLNSALIANCYNMSVVKGEANYTGAITGGMDYEIVNCYYLSGVATDGNGIIQNGKGYNKLGEARADVDGQAKGFATAKEVVMAYGGVEAYVDYAERQLENADKANADEIERLQGELDVAEQALADAKTALENADKANADEIERLQGELDTAEQALADAKTALDTAKGELVAKDNALAQKDAALEETIAENKAQAEIDVDTLEEELLATKAELTDANGANKTLGVIGLVIGCVSFVGMGAMAAFTFLKKKEN